MKLNQLAMGITLALSPLLLTGHASASSSPWWEEFSSNAGFIEALPHIGTSLEELRQDTEKGLRDSFDSRTPLFWLKRTMEMYPPGFPDRYNMPVAHHETKDWVNAPYATMGRGIFFFTRTFGEAGQNITVSVGNIPAGAKCYAATGREFADKDAMYLDQQQLTAQSDNTYTFKKSGVLLLGCGDPDKQQVSEFVPFKINGGSNSHLFILGQSSQNDWAGSKTVAGKFGFALLYDGHANTVVPNRIAQQTDEMVGKVLGDNLRVAALYEKINGMDGTEYLFTSPRGSMFTNYDNCCFADYRNGYIGVGFHANRMNDKNGDNWGVWHEIGHEYEPIKEAFSTFSEIQVNRYSIEACQMFKGREVPLNQCHVDISPEEGIWDKQAVANFIASGMHYPDYSAINNLWKQLNFFSRLRFSYGEDFFPHVNQRRLKAIQQAPGTTIAEKTDSVIGSKQKVIDFSVVAYSQAAGQDLRQYFTQWGLNFSAQAGQKVADLKLPQPGEEQGEQPAPQVNLSRDNIVAVATYNNGFGYSVTASSDQNDVSYQWKRIDGDARIYTKTNNTATVEVVIPKNVANVSTRFEVTASSKHGSDRKTLTVSAIAPAVDIIGPVSMDSTSPVQLEAQANFEQASYDWSLLKGNQVVTAGVDQHGQVKSGLEAGSYTVKVTATSVAGARTASQNHTINVTTPVQNSDQAFVTAAKLKMIANDRGESMVFSGGVSADVTATSTPSYRWTLPTVAHGGTNGWANQSFTVTKTTQPQTLKVKVTVTAGNHSRDLEEGITVPAIANGGSDYPAWVYGTRYTKGDVVKHDGKLFECTVAGWCSQTGQWSQMHYEPGKGISWTQAWKYH
ncbi:Chitinase [Pantoea sp. AS-PWVM4]|uniref:M60 family metallopeptidase n=1 Tax=Pantoea sp. AS-PWVM4 TaxID=1332069 RepID=UPI0003AC6B24|nr:M60 family metallopeptidase [Pantoea sp. AS-PWVM4]ERK17241.1 Chitinase [Pantoea sp. AS-PWVM4]